MRRKLNVRQRLFVDALLGPAHGVQATAARLAGYQGSTRGLAVQGSRLMRNLEIQRLIHECCAARVERSMQVYDGALRATKRKVFAYKGHVLYSDEEPDHAIQMRAADRLLELGLLSRPEGPGEHVDEIGANNEEEADMLKKAIASLNPTDINLIRRTCEINEKLSRIQQEVSDDDDGSKRSHES